MPHLKNIMFYFPPTSNTLQAGAQRKIKKDRDDPEVFSVASSLPLESSSNMFQNIHYIM